MKLRSSAHTFLQYNQQNTFKKRKECIILKLMIETQMTNFEEWKKFNKKWF